jgi:hypothetical protein
MKSLIGVFVLLVASVGFAHDEGHGPKVSDNANERAVILAKDAKLGTKAKAVSSATLERLGDDDIGVILKSTAETLGETAQATLIPTSSRKKAKPQTFKLAKVTEDGKTLYKGVLPHLGHGLYELEVKFKLGSNDVLVAFPNVEGHSH